MWTYVIILSVLLLLVLILYIKAKRTNNPAKTSIIERSKLEKMLEKELTPKAQLAEEAVKEDFRYRSDYRKNVTDMTGNDIVQEEYKISLKSGISKLKIKDYDGAELEFAKIIESGTANAGAYYYRGLIKNFRNEYSPALNDFDLALTYGFSAPDIHFQKGYSNLKLKQYDKAADDFSKFISLKPNNAEARFSKGLCEVASERLTEALAEFTKTIELNPNYEIAFYERGKIYIKLGNKEEACKDFKEAYRLGCIPAHHYLSSICNEKGR